ncbi:DUF4011 domain-containing protein [Bradyrhizobium sp. AZCC 2289]|uniref:DUF4011 domain-containing protein n=1 Tax=Bradyrhizobium sp. AZCC 2289 TaxID=3117026 RepID=UPI002FF1F153
MADRRALLDLGTRNRLINIPLRTKNIRAIEIVDCKSVEVFDLLGQAKRCTFVPTEGDKSTSVADVSMGTTTAISTRRRQFLTMMSPDVIADIKQAGIEDYRAAWDVLEEAARDWLKRRKTRRTS